MYIPVSEQETTINIFRDSKEVVIWTCDGTMITKLDKMCKASPDNYRIEKIDYFDDGTIASKEYVIADKNLISFRSARVKLTEEQKAARVDNMKRSKGLNAQI